MRARLRVRELLREFRIALSDQTVRVPGAQDFTFAGNEQKLVDAHGLHQVGNAHADRKPARIEVAAFQSDQCAFDHRIVFAERRDQSAQISDLGTELAAETRERKLAKLSETFLLGLPP